MNKSVITKLLTILAIIIGMNIKQESQAEYIPPGACWRWIEDAEGTTRGCMPDPSPKSKNIDICKIIKSVTETCHGERRGGGGGGSSSGKTMPSPKQSAPDKYTNQFGDKNKSLLPPQVTPDVIKNLPKTNTNDEVLLVYSAQELGTICEGMFIVRTPGSNPLVISIMLNLVQLGGVWGATNNAFVAYGKLDESKYKDLDTYMKNASSPGNVSPAIRNVIQNGNNPLSAYSIDRFANQPNNPVNQEILKVLPEIQSACNKAVAGGVR